MRAHALRLGLGPSPLVTHPGRKGGAKKLLWYQTNMFRMKDQHHRNRRFVSTG